MTEAPEVRARIRARVDAHDARRAIRFDVGPLRAADDAPAEGAPTDDPAEQEI